MNDAEVLHAIELDDSYEVLRVLAQGPSGTTELVMRGDAGPFVRKRIPLGLANRAAWDATAHACCQRVPRVTDIYCLPDELVTVCEFVPGERLDARMQRLGTLSPDEAIKVATEVCEAASALHAAGVIHRDISPKNVILAADGAHLIDLGIARTKTAGAPRDTTLLGTWGFAAPEQYGFAQSDERSDVYAIGRLLQFMLTGETADTLPGDGSVPARLADVITRATAFEPSARFGSADELGAALSLAGSSAPSGGRSLIAFAARRRMRARAGLVRKIREAPLARRASALFVLALFAIMVVDAVQTLYARWPMIDPASRVEDTSFALMMIAHLAFSGHQCASAIVGAGSYGHEQHKIRRLVINLFIALMAMALLVVAITRLT